MMRAQAILKFSLGPFFQRVGKVVMMRAQAPLRLPLWPFFQRTRKLVMMRARAVLESSPSVFSANPKTRHDAHASRSESRRFFSGFGNPS